ncbi:5-methylcytosine-specific restriction enzyme subunit McrC [Polystyrenella longa]|uniref:5-methylcytosine-specific restriction enzyme subunit McrC n=1 Tax=Polystyrenella longa TaxID=2528007 RepID=A0A518CTV7_9PLAN|nr:restriction endonuclease [Polystyrenella longa]QDU82614.1 5-methylcytosine-specific restriction enzyme subunit McrC [Polystyrenella longa]
MNVSLAVKMEEWQSCEPELESPLHGLALRDLNAEASVVEKLNSQRLLKLIELRSGISLRTFSYVGRLQIGNLRLTIHPKINGTSLLRLLRYAYGFRKLKLISNTTHLTDEYGFEDLLIAQLLVEAEELISRGLSRAYRRQDERLASPRGRINLQQLAREAGTITATLPCQHFPRVEDILLNQVLLAGLQLAARMASLKDLRREAHRLMAQFDEQVTRINLNEVLLDRAEHQLNRMTTAYTASLTIIRTLYQSQGILLEGTQSTISLPGFLFDMNAFFQTLLSRFLRDHLPQYTVRDEHGLKGMMRYLPKYNPQHRQSPTPRPDFAIFQNGQLLTLLDAKYRDLWEKPLPREMLYQLTVYAISQRHHPASAILYATTNPNAREQRIEITDPIYDHHLGQVSLRPVNLNRLEELISSETIASRRECEELACRLVLGDA